MSSARQERGVLVVHHDVEHAHWLARMFEQRGSAATTASTSVHAMSHLRRGDGCDVVVAEWDVDHGVGGVVYRWVLGNRPDLRGQFVFVGDHQPADFDRLVGGRCLAVSARDVDGLVEIAESAMRRRARVHEVAAIPVVVGVGRPTLLLADDDPIVLQAMSRLLHDAGFAVTGVSDGDTAVARLVRRDFDVIVLDWHMAHGSGVDVYRWIAGWRPALADRVVFISGGPLTDLDALALGRPALPKAYESTTLIVVLRAIARQSRGIAPDARLA